MIILKNDYKYIVKESTSKWIVEKKSDKLSVVFDISKEICKTEDELKKYILSNDLF